MLVGNDNNNNDDDYNVDPNIDTGDYEEQVNTVDVDIDEDIEVQEEASQLASTPGKNVLFLGVALIVSLYLVYNLAFKKTEEEKQEAKTKEIIKSQPVTKNMQKPTQDLDGIQIGLGVAQAPELPQLETDTIIGTSEIDPLEEEFVEEEEEGNIFEQWPTFNEKDDGGGFNPGDWKQIDVNVDVPKEEPEPPAVVVLPPAIKTPAPAIPVVRPPSNPITAAPPRRAPVQPVRVDPSEAQRAANKLAKMRQPMVVMGGGGRPGEGPGSRGGKNNNKELDKLISSDFELGISSSEKTEASLIGNTDNMIAQGKIIDVVLETAINTDLEGVIRAIVSRDVYAESGRNILIPKGSRLIGSYNPPDEGIARVVIEWSRVIRPDGIDVMIDSPGTDKMGRAGIPGFVDNKYFDIIKNAILLSTLSVGSAIMVDDITESQQQTSTTTSSADGSTSTSNSGTTTDAAVLSAVNDISDIADTIAEGLLNDQPTVIVQQGTKMKVFVNRDLHFPRSIASDVRFVN